MWVSTFDLGWFLFSWTLLCTATWNQPWPWIVKSTNIHISWNVWDLNIRYCQFPRFVFMVPHNNFNKKTRTYRSFLFSSHCDFLSQYNRMIFSVVDSLFRHKLPLCSGANLWIPLEWRPDLDTLFRISIAWRGCINEGSYNVTRISVGEVTKRM